MLSQAGYPALIVSASVDRGQYYDALALSDEGNILTLYDLFAQIIRRTVKSMSRPNYAQDVLQNRLLNSIDGKRIAWLTTITRFSLILESALLARGWSLTVQGYPDGIAFSLLGELSSDGNSWFAVLRDEVGLERYLLWFGYNSTELRDLLGDRASGYPSIFVSTRDVSPVAVHPYIHLMGSDVIPDELLIKPLEAGPVTWRSRYESKVLPLESVAEAVAQALTGGCD